jgi:hypothetical protein
MLTFLPKAISSRGNKLKYFNLLHVPIIKKTKYQKRFKKS